MHSIEEKNKLLQQLDEAREDLKSAVWGLSERQSNFKPSPGGWSIAGVVEHLATVEGFVVMRLEQMTSAADEGHLKDSDTVLFGKVVDRSTKFQAPERAHPTGKPLANSMETLASTRRTIVEMIRSGPDAHFREHTSAHPVFGPMDGHQWVVAVAGHCARHTKQILETKASPEFPGQ
jgi:hypothetical protein